MGCRGRHRRHPPDPGPAPLQDPRTPRIPSREPRCPLQHGSVTQQPRCTTDRLAAAPAQPLADYETSALAVAARAGKTKTPITIATPGGRAACRCSLPFTRQRCGCRASPHLFPARMPARSRWSPARWCGAPNSPASTPLTSGRPRTASGPAACRPAVAPLPAGKPAQQNPGNCSCSSARSRDGRYPRCRRRWWSSMLPTSPGSSPLTRPPGHGHAARPRSCSLTSPAGPGWRAASPTHAAGRRSSLPARDGHGLSTLAPVRGHAVVLDAAILPGLQTAAALLAARGGTARSRQCYRGVGDVAAAR